MPKYTKEFKIKLVTEYLSGKSGGQETVAKKYNVPYSTLNAVNGRAEEILRVDGFRRGRELPNTGAERETAPKSNGTVSENARGADLGEQFTSYARQLRDNAKVLVGIYRLEALEKAGKDAGLSSITKEWGDK